MMIAWVLILAQTAPPPSVPPLHGGEASMTCPVGGETFSGWQAGGSYATYGERPDGRPYSYMPFPFPLAECPSNHLVVFDDFSDADKDALAKLIATPAYAKLVADGETPHYRAGWLARRLGRSEPESLRWLQAALWAETPGILEMPDTVENRTRRSRYAREFVDRVRHLPADTSAKDRLWLTARAANQLRQLGDFDGAEAVRRDAVLLVGQPGVGEGWDRYLASLAHVIARRDASAEPLDMIPVQEAASRCAKPGDVPLSRVEKRLCATPEIAAEIHAD